MKIIHVNNEQEGGQVAFDFVEKTLKAHQHPVFGLATGSTPLSLYHCMRTSDLDFSNSIGINLDEYIGLGKDNPQSYAYFMQEQLYQDKPFMKTFIPDGLAKDAQAECDRYDDILKQYPIDLQILGIGTNGHIGFNEPGSSFELTTHRVALTESTIEANQRFFEDKSEVPRFAYSMGIGSILQAKEIILMAYGKHKAQAIYDMINGPVDIQCPASALQNHPKVTVIVDEAAASLI